MHGIISLLDGDHYARVEALWAELEEDCGLSGVKVTPLPHFTWQIAEAYDLEAVRPTLQELACSLQPFTVRTTGLGLFTGEPPVVYIPVVKDALLLELHALIWERVLGLSQRASPLYAPEFWVPHITLAYGDVIPQKLTCLMEHLSGRTFNWEIQVDHLALVYQIEANPAWQVERIAFGC